MNCFTSPLLELLEYIWPTTGQLLVYIKNLFGVGLSKRASCSSSIACPSFENKNTYFDHEPSVHTLGVRDQKTDKDQKDLFHRNSQADVQTVGKVRGSRNSRNVRERWIAQLSVYFAELAKYPINGTTQ